MKVGCLWGRGLWLGRAGVNEYYVVVVTVPVRFRAVCMKGRDGDDLLLEGSISLLLLLLLLLIMIC